LILVALYGIHAKKTEALPPDDTLRSILAELQWQRGQKEKELARAKAAAAARTPAS
jgi:hypothetical protein